MNFYLCRKSIFHFKIFQDQETVLFFSVQNVEAEDGNDNWDYGWYAGRVSSSVVVHERHLGTDIHDAKRREPRCSFSVLMCESRGMVGVPAKPNNPRRDKAQPQT